ncbi:MAG: hypothetical protein DMF52_01645 [Acidobacteria bacterium]|nr:MAG: hypothetical protein DMF52_01645 [Acidobacteriota bacterium]
MRGNSAIRIGTSPAAAVAWPAAAPPAPAPAPPATAPRAGGAPVAGRPRTARVKVGSLVDRSRRATIGRSAVSRSSGRPAVPYAACIFSTDRPRSDKARDRKTFLSEPSGSRTLNSRNSGYWRSIADSI